MSYHYYMQGYLKNNLDSINLKAIPNKWDALFIIFGREGSGKTTLATQNSHYLSKKQWEEYGMDLTVFTPEQFMSAIDKAPDESSILWDEAITGANVATHAGKVSQAVISKLTQIRKKKLKIFICFPYLHMLNKYFIYRCAGAFYVYAKGFEKRGFYNFYNQTRLKRLYYLMKERYKANPDIAMSKTVPNFFGKFSNVFCLDEKEYDKKKEKARMEDTETGNLWRDRFVIALEMIRNKEAQNISQVATKIGVKPASFYQLIKNYPVSSV